MLRIYKPAEDKGSAFPRPRPKVYPSKVAPWILPRRQRPAPHLPNELIALIVDNLKTWGEPVLAWRDERDTLLALSRTSKAFLGPARRALYDTICLSGVDDSLLPTESIPAFKLWKTLTSAPHLAMLVRRLELTPASRTILPHTAIVVNTFPNLTELSVEMRWLGGFEARDLFSSLARKCPPLVALSVQLPPAPCPGLPALLRSQGTLKLLTVRGQDGATEDNLMDSGSPPTFRLTSLTISAGRISPPMLQFLTSYSHTTLSELLLDGSAPFRSAFDFAPFVSLVNLTLEGPGDTIPVISSLRSLKTLPLTHLNLEYLDCPDADDGIISIDPFYTSLPTSLVELNLPEQRLTPFVDFIVSNQCPSLVEVCLATYVDRTDPYVTADLRRLFDTCADRNLWTFITSASPAWEDDDEPDSEVGDEALLAEAAAAAATAPAVAMAKPPVQHPLSWFWSPSSRTEVLAGAERSA